MKIGGSSTMSFNKTKVQYEHGFTIVELLIVIVVIGILAAITIVSFNGVSSRANAANAKSAANAAIKKGEAYNAETNGYPSLPTNLTDASAAGKTYQLNGVIFNTAGADGTAPIVKPASPSVVNFYDCTVGQRYDYWDYTTSAWIASYSGGGTLANCPAATYLKG